MIYSQPVVDIIRRRYSCRTYKDNPIAEDTRKSLAGFIARLPPGPFACADRFELVSATRQDRSALRGLGTYGFIRGASGFIIGASRQEPAGDGLALSLEVFGYHMEAIILAATDLGLGTCWLGGSFTRSSFAHKIDAGKDEIIPAVAAVGIMADGRSRLEQGLRQRIGAADRLSWDRLFFAGDFGTPLTAEAAGAYALPLEMVRIGPSASNKQPWRIVKDACRWHFFLQRTPGYRESFLARMLGVADMQRVDLGIAMAHFQLSAENEGLNGRWEITPPARISLPNLTSYTATWHPDQA
jgi:nitroreductase